MVALGSMVVLEAHSKGVVQLDNSRGLDASLQLDIIRELELEHLRARVMVWATGEMVGCRSPVMLLGEMTIIRYQDKIQSVRSPPQLR